MHEALLRCALVEPAAAGAALKDLNQAYDLDDVRDSESHQLLPLVHHNVAAAGVVDDALPRLRGAHRRSWLTNQQLLHRVRSPLERVHHRGIDLMLLKGVPLALRYYGDLGLRPMKDVDALVHRGDAEAVIALVVSEGWRPLFPDLDRELRTKHGTTFVDDEGGELDVHWELGGLLSPRGTARIDVWDAAEPFEWAGLALLAPAPADLLLHVIVHGVWIESAAAARWVADAAMVIHAAGPELDWDRLLARASALPATVLPLRNALAYLRDTFDVDVPEPVIARLARIPVSRHDRRSFRIISGDLELPAVFGATGRTLAKWRHRSAGWDRWRRARELPGFLGYQWGVQHTWQLPGEVVRKAGRRLVGRHSARSA